MASWAASTATEAMGAVEGGMDAAMDFMGMGDTAVDAKHVVGAAANGIVNPIPSVESMVSGTGDAVGNLAVGVNAAAPGIASSSGLGGLKGWALDALGKSMPKLLESALAPKPQPRAPLGGSGHGVQASTSSYGQVVNEIEGMAGGDPLNGLTGFKNLL
ncbi:hypothetical protein LSB85_003680 [Salmonella enterica]|nr:hypothetical protein [Salmonella enterica]